MKTLKRDLERLGKIEMCLAGKSFRELRRLSKRMARLQGKILKRMMPMAPSLLLLLQWLQHPAYSLVDEFRLIG